MVANRINLVSYAGMILVSLAAVLKILWKQLQGAVIAAVIAAFMFWFVCLHTAEFSGRPPAHSTCLSASSTWQPWATLGVRRARPVRALARPASASLPQLTKSPNECLRHYCQPFH